MNPFSKIWSYFFPITLQKYRSDYSGTLLVMLEDGKKVLNTPSVNYSFNSLHRIFRQAFKTSHLRLSDQSRVLVLGLGAGSIVNIIRREYKSSAKITAVEIDPVVIDIAKNEFNIEQQAPIEIIRGDAFGFMAELKETYHLICVDLFIHDEVPAKFLSSEFMISLISALEPKGQIYFNFMAGSFELTALFDARLHELSTSSQIPLTHISRLNLEENNRVLVVTK